PRVIARGWVAPALNVVVVLSDVMRPIDSLREFVNQSVALGPAAMACGEATEPENRVTVPAVAALACGAEPTQNPATNTTVAAIPQQRDPYLRRPNTMSSPHRKCRRDAIADPSEAALCQRRIG